jgi:putative heme-binding domain-containing protein
MVPFIFLRRASLLMLSGACFASQPKSAADIPDPTVEAEQKAFIVPEGFEINLWAAEPLLRKPVQMNWDAQGRLWVVCSTTYPQIKPGEEAIDQVVVLEDTDGDGKADKSTLFADDLHIPTAVIPADGGAYVANSTEILFLKDTDGDGKADFRQVVLSGFGTEDTHHLVHTFRFSPEGLLNFNQSIYIHSHLETPHGVKRLMGGGVWQHRKENGRTDVFCKGLVNPWGLEYDKYGQSFATDGAGSQGINYLFPGAVFLTSPGAKRIVQGLNPGQPKHCGLEVISEPHLPDDWQGTLVTCDFRGNRVNRFQLTENGSGYLSKQMPDVLASTHRGFRPIDVRTGPDGALYIADWFNPIIQHGEVDFRDPRRDRTNGRIWRLTAKGRPLTKSPDFSKLSTAELVEQQVSSERRWNRQFASQTLRDRDKTEVVAAIEKTLGDGAAEEVGLKVLQAVWALETINHHDPKLVAKLLESKDHHIRAAGLRILSQRLAQNKEALKLLEVAVKDEHPQVRLWALGCLYFVSQPEAVPVALRVLDKPVDDNLDFLLELICREQSDIWLPVFLKGKLKIDDNPKHLVYALKATGKAEALQPLLEGFAANKLGAEDSAALLEMAGALATPQQLDQLLGLVAKPELAARRLGILDALLKAGQRGAKPSKADEAVLLSLLDSGDVDRATRAAELAGFWKMEGLRGRLTELVSSKEGSAPVRAAAVRGLTALGGAGTSELFVKLSSDGEAAETRVLAIHGLTDVAPDLAAKQAVAYLATAETGAAAQPVFQAFLKNKNLPPLLVKALEGKNIPEAAAIEGIRLANTRGVGAVLEEALRRAGAVRKMDRPLSEEEMAEMVKKVAASGDPARGEIVYRQQQLLCITCHAIGGIGGKIGPDMVSLGASAPVDYIIESLLNPTAKIKEGYHMTMITTKSGQVYAGAIAQDSGDELQIRDAGNNLHKVAKSEIVQNTISPVSMMPPGLTANLREDEFIDLVRFLSELGREGNYKTPSNHYVRLWRSMGEMSPADIDHVRHVGLFTLSDRSRNYPWDLRVGMVNGDVPLQEIPAVKMHPWYPIAILQCDLEMASAGKVTLKLSHHKGLLMAYGDKVLQEVDEQVVLDLPAGKTAVSILIGRDAGEVKGFKVEIVEGAAKVVTTL